MKKLETHYDVNWFHFVEHDDWTCSIISRTGHDKLQFRKSKPEILEQFKDALEEFLEKWNDDICLWEIKIKIFKWEDWYYADMEHPPVLSSLFLDKAMNFLLQLRMNR